MLSIRYVRALVEGAVQCGVARAELLRAAQLRDEQLAAAEGRVTLGEFYHLCDRALHLSGDPALGLRACESTNPYCFDLLAYVIAHAPTLRDALECQVGLHKLLSDTCPYQLIDDAGHTSMLFVGLGDAPPWIARLLAEMHIAGLYRMFRYFAPDAAPVPVSFAYGAPVHRAEYQRVFEGGATFDAEHTGIGFTRTLLATPSPCRNPELYATLRIQVESRIARLERDRSHAERIRHLIITQPTLARANMNTVARALGTSARSLRRQLTVEGASYNAIVSASRGAVATQLLSVEQRTVQQTAQAMGYADASAFHRAFKRWTGTTPSTCRAPRLA